MDDVLERATEQAAILIRSGKPVTRAIGTAADRFNVEYRAIASELAKRNSAAHKARLDRERPMTPNEKWREARVDGERVAAQIEAGEDNAIW